MPTAGISIKILAEFSYVEMYLYSVYFRLIKEQYLKTPITVQYEQFSMNPAKKTAVIIT